MMADRNRNQITDDEEKPTKEDLAVAKFLRFNVPTNGAKFHGMEVQCFSASSAVDCLLNSSWSSFESAEEPLFSNRKSCTIYCQRLLQKGLFHRAERVIRKKDMGGKSKKKTAKDSQGSQGKDDGGTGVEFRERKLLKDKQRKNETDDAALEGTEQAEEEKEKTAEEEKVAEKKEEREKKKRKPLKLVMTDNQRFLDGEQYIYVWIYDPASVKTLLIGSLIVLGSIALCLYPLWPPVVRVGVYYISLVAAAFVIVILSLIVIRLILFCLIWLVSQGRHRFWLLPNLTEDVSILESFHPWYSHHLVDEAAPATTPATDMEGKLSVTGAQDKNRSSDKEDSASEQDEFEMVQRGDVEEEEGLEEEEDMEENGTAGEEKDEDAELEKDEDGSEEEEEGEAEKNQIEDEREETELKKDK